MEVSIGGGCRVGLGAQAEAYATGRRTKRAAGYLRSSGSTGATRETAKAMAVLGGAYGQTKSNRAA